MTEPTTRMLDLPPLDVDQDSDTTHVGAESQPGTRDDDTSATGIITDTIPVLPRAYGWPTTSSSSSCAVPASANAESSLPITAGMDHALTSADQMRIKLRALEDKTDKLLVSIFPDRRLPDRRAYLKRYRSTVPERLDVLDEGLTAIGHWADYIQEQATRTDDIDTVIEGKPVRLSIDYSIEPPVLTVYRLLPVQSDDSVDAPLESVSGASRSSLISTVGSRLWTGAKYAAYAAGGLACLELFGTAATEYGPVVGQAMSSAASAIGKSEYAKSMVDQLRNAGWNSTGASLSGG